MPMRISQGQLDTRHHPRHRPHPRRVLTPSAFAQQVQRRWYRIVLPSVVLCGVVQCRLEPLALFQQLSDTAARHPQHRRGLHHIEHPVAVDLNRGTLGGGG